MYMHIGYNTFEVLIDRKKNTPPSPTFLNGHFFFLFFLFKEFELTFELSSLMSMLLTTGPSDSDC